jgi:hypothetical protein
MGKKDGWVYTIALCVCMEDEEHGRRSRDAKTWIAWMAGGMGRIGKHLSWFILLLLLQLIFLLDAGCNHTKSSFPIPVYYCWRSLR